MSKRKTPTFCNVGGTQGANPLLLGGLGHSLEGVDVSLRGQTTDRRLWGRRSSGVRERLGTQHLFDLCAVGRQSHGATAGVNLQRLLNRLRLGFGRQFGQTGSLIGRQLDPVGHLPHGEDQSLVELGLLLVGQAERRAVQVESLLGVCHQLVVVIAEQVDLAQQGLLDALNPLGIGDDLAGRLAATLTVEHLVAGLGAPLVLANTLQLRAAALLTGHEKLLRGCSLGYGRHSLHSYYTNINIVFSQ